MLSVTSSLVQWVQVFIPLPPVLGQSRSSLNISPVSENWTWAGRRVLSAESAALSQRLRYTQPRVPEGEDSIKTAVPTSGWKAARVWFLSIMESLWGKGECHFWTTRFPFPPFLTLPSLTPADQFSLEGVQISFWVTAGFYWECCIFTISHGT